MSNSVSVFRRTVLRHWRKHGRHDLPWRPPTLRIKRGEIDPYRILVSEVMLQQTQVSRVIPKYQAFLRLFPTLQALADANTTALLAAWQGLGYNRRALALQRCAQHVLQQHGGRFPRDHAALRSLPGIGPYTASALLVFAFDRPAPLLETNIRRVYLHHFFSGRENVPDTELMPSVMEHGSRARSPRIWFSALMDYGSWLATQIPNPNTRSRHYTRQSTFEGSQRQLRGRVLRVLLRDGSLTQRKLMQAVGEDERLPAVVARLETEGFLHRRGKHIRIQSGKVVQ